MKEYKKIYSVYLFKKHIFEIIEDINKIDKKYTFKIIEDKYNKNFIFIEKYINDVLYSKKYNSVDCIYEYLQGIKGTLLDAR